MAESVGFPPELPAHTEVPELLEKLAREYLVPGVQFAVYDRGAVTHYVYGDLTHGSGRRVTPDTVFPLGSVTKTVTAMLLLQLVSDGEVELDEPVGPLLPELAHLTESPLYTATLRGLLSHTAGLPDMPEGDDDLPLRASVAASAAAAALCGPGRFFSYSNLGYVLAGRLLEAVADLSWWEAVRSFVLRPLGVEPGFLGEAPGAGDSVVSQHAVHLPTGSVHVVDEPGLPKALVPAGALMTSAADLLKFTAAHLGGDGPEVLEPELLAEAHRTVPGSQAFGLAEGWGLGMAVYSDGAGHRWLGHDGNTGGASCALRLDPERGVAVALMTNATSGRQMGNQFFAELAALGLDIGRSQEPSLGAPLSGAELRAAAQEVCGTYRSGAESVTVRWSADGELLLDRGQLLPVRIELRPGLEFRLRGSGSGDASGTEAHDGPTSDESNDLYRFVRDSRAGRVGGMYLSGGRLQVREDIGRLG